MLVHAYQRGVPERDAWLRRTMFRHRDFGVAVVRSRGITNDFGLLGEVAAFARGGVRRQLSIVLAGRAYFVRDGRWEWLGPGDAVEADQRLGEREGYGGAESEVILIEWDAGSWFGEGPRASRVSRLGAGDVERLRRLVAEVDVTPPAVWIASLGAMLRGMGLPMEVMRAAELGAPNGLGRVYAALGDALGALERQPSLPELADALGIGERQARRQLAELEQYGHPFEGWRDFVHANRLTAAIQLLSVPGISLQRVSQLSGYGSAIALCHAFSGAGADAPGEFARKLARHWG